jgi:dipeptidyl aminopeptidase/acylaminoacyl peptidase
MPTSTKPFRPRDVLEQVMIQDLAVSPEGTEVVYSRRTIEDGAYRSRLWRVPANGGPPERLTSAKSLDRRPRISPDGRTLLFVSDRSGRSQPWVLPLGGGEPHQLVEIEGEVAAAEWSPSGRNVLLLAPSGVDRFVVGRSEDPTARRIRDLTWRLDGVGIRDRFTSVWVVTARGGRPRRVTDATFDVAQAFWSPAGERVGFVADLRPEAAIEEHPQVWSVPAAGGRPRKEAELAGAVLSAEWGPDGALAVLGIDRPQSPEWSNVGLFVSRRRRVRRLAAERDITIWNTTFGDLVDMDAWLPPALVWLDAEHVLALVADRGASHPYRFGLDGSVERLADGDVVCSSLAAGGGRVVAVASDRGRPGEVCLVEDGALRPLTRNGSRWMARFRQDPERIAVTHREGHTIDAWLLPARGRRRRGPLVLQVHGGPNLSHGPTPWLEMLALADAGIHVLYANPRGSTGYGEAYASAITQAWGDRDASDLLRVVERAVRQGLADPGRLGVMGLSYGGFMTNWLLANHPGRFAAAVSENPVTDALGMLANSDAGRWLGREVTGEEVPLERLDRWLAMSSFTRIHRNEAPLLLLQSENDLRCPPGQSDIVFTILRGLGREVELVRYPDEPHIGGLFGRPDRRVDRLERIVGWFTRHLRPAAR